MIGFYYPIQGEIGFSRKGTKAISEEEYAAIKDGDIVTYRGAGREFLVTYTGGPSPWGKEIIGGKTVGNSLPLYRSDIAKVEK